MEVVNFREEPSPLLVMPYFSLGNLEDLHRDSPITVEEIVVILFQCLEALGYLHPRNVTHRDIKPENILIECRDPLSIKFADFGLAKVAKDDSKLKTRCGTPLYAAPEIYSGEEYSPAVDLWSVGVVALHYAYGLREQFFKKRRQKFENMRANKEWGLYWCQHIVFQAHDWDPEPLIDLLAIGMLRINPDEKLPAGECLRKGSDLGLFDDRAFDTVKATPTQQTDQQHLISDDDGSTTIILGVEPSRCCKL